MRRSDVKTVAVKIVFDDSRRVDDVLMISGNAQ